MEAFPAVLKKVPTAKLIVAGANHHTKPGYWESIRDSHNLGSRVEFRGYVPEEAIPELYSTTSVVVMPYDSATGSSGPAHQACEYGVPIVCADIADFRDMAADEDMAVNFSSEETQPISPINSPAFCNPRKLQRQMAEQNFSAAIQMTLPSVVRIISAGLSSIGQRKLLGPRRYFAASVLSGSVVCLRVWARFCQAGVFALTW